MRTFNTIILFLVITLSCVGQEYGRFKIGQSFNSVFADLSSGQFDGTVNGAIFIQNEKEEITILDFQSGNANLKMVPDTNEVYDSDTKLYSGFTTSGKTKVYYSTYSMSNKITVVLSSGNFTAGSHDGAADMVINGVNYSYYSEESTEYLTVTFDRDVTLDNFWWLRDSGKTTEEAHELKKEIIIKANSSVVFAINRK